MRKDAYPSNFVTSEHPHKTRRTATTLPTYHVCLGPSTRQTPPGKGGTGGQTDPQGSAPLRFHVSATEGHTCCSPMSFLGRVSAHEQGAHELLKNLQTLGYHEATLKFDGEPALTSAQEEVRRRREAPTILESLGVGNSQANGAAKRVVQAPGKQVRVLSQGLESAWRSRLAAPTRWCRGWSSMLPTPVPSTR